MTPGFLKYSSGEDVLLGDRVEYGGTVATVVFMTDGESCESSPGYEDYAGVDPGLLICDDDGGVTQLGEPDDRLLFMERA
jgi:hypothetical protein